MRDHARHGGYVIEHALLPGFSPDELAVLATGVRYQRSGKPSAAYLPCARLAGSWRARAKAVAAVTHAVRTAVADKGSLLVR